MTQTLDELLLHMADMDATDLHLRVDEVPRFRVHGNLVAPADATPVSLDAIRDLVAKMLDPRKVEELEGKGEIDLVHSVGEDLRLRATIFRELGGYGAAFRRIARDVPKFDALGLPPAVAGFVEYPSGLVVIAGPSGSGRTTTLHCLIDRANDTLQRHVLTLEGLIEFSHRDRKSLIHQRQVGVQAHDVAHSILHSLQQSPDILVVEELHEPEAVQAACLAAESGVLVLATIQANGALQAIEKLVNAFPGDQAAAGRGRIAGCLRAILCQHLLRRQFGVGATIAPEILLNTELVAGFLREDKQLEVQNAMVRYRSLGMRLLDDSLQELVEQNVILPEDALATAVNKQRFEGMIRNASFGRQR